MLETDFSLDSHELKCETQVPTVERWTHNIYQSQYRIHIIFARLYVNQILLDVSTRDLPDPELSTIRTTCGFCRAHYVTFLWQSENNICYSFRICPINQVMYCSISFI